MTKRSCSNSGAEDIESVLAESRAQSGESLAELCEASPILLVFLRHSGCLFCREALEDVAEVRADLEVDGIRIVLVHMGETAALRALLNKRGLEQLKRIYDPQQRLYQAFGLRRGTFGQLFGWKVFFRAVVEGVVFRHGIGRVSGDPAQLSGVFLIRGGMIERRFRHRSAADRPDLPKMLAGEL